MLTYIGHSRRPICISPVGHLLHPVGGLLTSHHLVCKVVIQCAIQHPLGEFHVATTSESRANVITSFPIFKHDNFWIVMSYHIQLL